MKYLRVYTCSRTLKLYTIKTKLSFNIYSFKEKNLIISYSSYIKRKTEIKIMSKLTKSEEELGQRVDRCIQDTVIKTASGIGLGIIFSVVLFKSNILKELCNF